LENEGDDNDDEDPEAGGSDEGEGEDEDQADDEENEFGGEGGEGEEGEGRISRDMKMDLFGNRGDISEEDENEGLSTHERNQKKVKEIIQQLEDENMGAKHWTLKGEITSKTRPVNSLLEESLDYEHATKTVPVVTDATTLSLEEMIKKRILDVSGFNTRAYSLVSL